MSLAKVAGSAVTLVRWMLAQSGKVPSWKMVCAQVFMARLSSRTPITFIRSPVRACNGAQSEGGSARGPLYRWKSPGSESESPSPRTAQLGSDGARHKPRLVDTQDPSVFTCLRLTLKELKMSPLTEWFLGARHCAMQLSQSYVIYPERNPVRAVIIIIIIPILQKRKMRLRELGSPRITQPKNNLL